MKLRNDFVTNSSSSSFIISRNNISRGRLLEVLLEIANEEAKRFEYEDGYTWKDIEGDCVAYRYHITEATTNNPYTDWNDREYTNDFIIDNECCGRYDWDVIEEVLGKYDIQWWMGYCD